MKIREGFMLRKVAGEHVAVPIGETARQFSGMIRLNEMGAFLWEALAVGGVTRADLLQQVLDRYAVDADRAVQDIDAFLTQLLPDGLLLGDDQLPLTQLPEV